MRKNCHFMQLVVFFSKIVGRGVHIVYVYSRHLSLSPRFPFYYIPTFYSPGQKMVGTCTLSSPNLSSFSEYHESFFSFPLMNKFSIWLSDPFPLQQHPTSSVLFSSVWPDHTNVISKTSKFKNSSKQATSGNFSFSFHPLEKKISCILFPDKCQ